MYVFYIIWLFYCPKNSFFRLFFVLVEFFFSLSRKTTTKTKKMSLSLFSHSTSRLIVARLISQRGMATTTASPLEELVEQGVTVIKTNTKKEVVEGWREMAKEIEEGLKEQAGVIGVGREKGYREVFQSDEGRFHFPLNHLLPVRDVRDVPTQADFVFAEQKKKLVNETLGLQTQLMDDMSKHVEQHAHDLFCSILSDSYEKSGQGVYSFSFFNFILFYFVCFIVFIIVLTFPFSTSQPELRVANPSSPAHKWHTNVSPLFGTEELEGNFLPPYALTVLVPLQTQGEKLGLTQFACGSQVRFHFSPYNFYVCFVFQT